MRKTNNEAVPKINVLIFIIILLREVEFFDYLYKNKKKLYLCNPKWLRSSTE